MGEIATGTPNDVMKACPLNTGDPDRLNGDMLVEDG